MSDLSCLECGAIIKLPSDTIQGEIVTCQDCGISFEAVKDKDGFTIRPAQVEGEDWGE